MQIFGYDTMESESIETGNERMRGEAYGDGQFRSENVHIEKRSQSFFENHQRTGKTCENHPEYRGKNERE